MGSNGTILREVKIRDCHILNTNPNTDTTNPTYGLQVTYARGLKVETTTIDTNTQGIAISGSSGLTFQNCKILNSAGSAIQTSGTTGLMEALTFDNLMIDTCGTLRYSLFKCKQCYIEGIFTEQCSTKRTHSLKHISCSCYLFTQLFSACDRSHCTHCPNWVRHRLCRHRSVIQLHDSKQTIRSRAYWNRDFTSYQYRHRAFDYFDQ